MIYQLEDKFLYKDQECVVRYINNGMAWLASVDNPIVTIGYIDEDGADKDGNTAYCMSQAECLAV